MTEYGQGPRSGARDNGLRCANYVMVGDLDPRVADSLLETLRDEGIAAYVTPTPAAQGGFLETRHSSRMTDRLYADAERTDRARELLPPPDPAAEIDFDSAWQQVLQSLQSPTDGTSASWPSSEDTPAEPVARDVPVELPVAEYRGYQGDPALDEHFDPPPPPPLPRLRKVTIIALIAIVAGVLILATSFDGGSLMWLAIVAIVSGVATLIWHMKDGPPIDSGWDDGAVV
jgi:hypothetical protein